MEPIRDTSLDAKPIAGKAATTTLAAGAQQQVPRAYPMDFRGTWSGTLTIFTRAFSPLKYQLDAAEATKEYNYMTPGKQGQTTITFFRAGQQLHGAVPGDVPIDAIDGRAERQYGQSLWHQLTTESDVCQHAEHAGTCNVFVAPG